MRNARSPKLLVIATLLVPALAFGGSAVASIPPIAG
jgi:hypothetical protein